MTASDETTHASSTEAPIRVLIVDDHRLVRQGLRLILDTEPGIEVVGEAENGEVAVEAVRSKRPDVVCMDLQMPVLDGVGATSRITADPELAQSRVLVLTTFRDDQSVRDALAAGASGFLLKNAPPETLVDAIRTLHAGDALLDPVVTRSVIEAATRAGAPPAAEHGSRPSPRPAAAAFDEAPGASELSSREREVLLGLAEGLSNADIAAKLFISEATVKTHVSNVLSKLGLRDRIQAVIYAYENRIVTPGD